MRGSDPPELTKLQRGGGFFRRSDPPELTKFLGGAKYLWASEPQELTIFRKLTKLHGREEEFGASQIPQNLKNWQCHRGEVFGGSEFRSPRIDKITRGENLVFRSTSIDNIYKITRSRGIGMCGVGLADRGGGVGMGPTKYLLA